MSGREWRVGNRQGRTRRHGYCDCPSPCLRRLVNFYSTGRISRSQNSATGLITRVKDNASTS